MIQVSWSIICKRGTAAAVARGQALALIKMISLKETQWDKDVMYCDAMLFLRLKQ